MTPESTDSDRLSFVDAEDRVRSIIDAALDTFIAMDDQGVIVDWNTDGSTHGGDVNHSGVVDVLDLVTVVLSWGPCVGPK